MVCEKADLDHLNAAGDPNSARYVSQFLDFVRHRTDLLLPRSPQVHLYVLPVVGAALARIAPRLDLNERTRSGRLAAEGLDFLIF
jgi:hypothetical protein